MDMPPLALRNIPRIGCCIYCESTDLLGREHVVPRGMGGTLTLPAASCPSCAKIIHNYETHCMRDTLIQVRVRHGLHNHPQERPLTFPVSFTYRDGRQSTEQIPVEDAPINWIMTLLEYPPVLSGKDKSDDMGLLHISHDDAAFKRLLKKFDAHSASIESPSTKVGTMHQWLAKIAFGYAVACLGFAAVRTSPLRGVILGQSPPNSPFIGGLNRPDREDRERFELESWSAEIFRIAMSVVRSSREIDFVAVYIRLLPFLNGPSYLIAVCEKEDDSIPLYEYVLGYKSA